MSKKAGFFAFGLMALTAVSGVETAEACGTCQENRCVSDWVSAKQCQDKKEGRVTSVTTTCFGGPDEAVLIGGNINLSKNPSAGGTTSKTTTHKACSTAETVTYTYFCVYDGKCGGGDRFMPIWGEALFLAPPLVLAGRSAQRLGGPPGRNLDRGLPK